MEKSLLDMNIEELVNYDNNLNNDNTNNEISNTNISTENFNIVKTSIEKNEQKINRLKFEGDNLDKLENYLKINIQETPIFRKSEELAYSFGEHLEMLDKTGKFQSYSEAQELNREFVEREGYNEVANEEYYKDIPQELKDKAIISSGHNEWALRRELDRINELNDREILLRNSSVWTQAGVNLLPMVADPVNLLLGLGIYKGLDKTLTVMSKAGEVSKVKKFGLGAIAGGLEGASTTLYTEGTNEYRDKEIMKENLMYSTIFGAAFGGALNSISLSDFKSKSKATADIEVVLPKFDWKTTTNVSKQEINKANTELNNYMNLRRQKVNEDRDILIKEQDINNVTDISDYHNYSSFIENNWIRLNQLYSKLNAIGKKYNSNFFTSLNNYINKDSISFGTNVNGKTVGQGKTIDVDIARKQDASETEVRTLQMEFFDNIKKGDKDKFFNNLGIKEDELSSYIFDTVEKIYRGENKFYTDLPIEMKNYLDKQFGLNGSKINEIKTNLKLDIDKENKFINSHNWDRYKFEKLERTIGRNKTIDILHKGILEDTTMVESKTLTKEVINRITRDMAESIYNRMIKRGSHTIDNNELMNVKNMLDELKKNGKISDEEIKSILSVSEKNKKNINNRTPSFLRDRIKINVFAETEINGVKYTPRDLLNTDFFENQYKLHRSLSSEQVMSKRGIVKYNGKEYDLSTQEGILEVKNTLRNENVPEKDIDTLIESFNNAKLGFVTEKTSEIGNINEIGQISRSTTNAVMLPASIASQFPETMKAVSKSLHRFALKDFKDTGDLINKKVNGELTPEENLVFEDIGLFFKEKVTSSRSYLNDIEENLGSSNKYLNWMLKKSRIAEQFSINTLSQMGRMTSKAKVMIATGEVRNFIKRAKKGKTLTDKMRSDLGITKLEEKEIYDFIKKIDNIENMRIDKVFEQFEKSGFRKSKVYEKFLDSIKNSVDNQIMRGYTGEGMKGFQETWYGKIALSLMTYPLNAYRRVGLKSLSHGTKETLAVAATEMIGLYMTYSFNTLLKSKNEEEMKEKMNDYEKFFTYSLGSNSFTAIPTIIVDTAFSLNNINLGISYRNKNVGNFFTGNPVVSTADKGLSLLSIPHDVITKDDYTAEDAFKSLKHLYGMKYLIDKIDNN